MLQMRQTIDDQTAMMKKMSAQLETLQVQEESEESEGVNMDWPEEKEEEKEPLLEEEVYDPLRNRREASIRSYKDVYATEKESFSENITLTDASSSRWGSMPQNQTRVGMRTRGLCLNPTLQQPSIGGLL